MEIYLAGGAGNRSRGWCLDKYLMQNYKAHEGNIDMDLYLAGQWPWKKEGIYDKILYDNSTNGFIDIAILESFYYADDWTETIIPHCRRFLLDNGAFTYLSSGKHVNWYEYLQRYIDFINRNKVQRFFELDIDALIGYPKVLEFRKILETSTGKRCIPVWHRSRGKQEFLSLCDQYDYIGLGGIAIKNISPKEYKYFPWFINEAHARGTKIHGLGFTNLNGLKQYKFDSVDSTTWTAGNRFGFVFTFNGETMIKTTRPEGKRIKDPKELAIRNFNEWVKFQKYAERYL